MIAGLSFPKTPIGCCSGCCIPRLTLTCSKKKATHKYSFPPDSTEVQETHRRRDRETKKVQKRWQWKVPQIKARDGKTRGRFFFTDSKTFRISRKETTASVMGKISDPKILTNRKPLSRLSPGPTKVWPSWIMEKKFAKKCRRNKTKEAK